MGIIFAVIILLGFIPFKFMKPKQFNQSYLSIEDTTAIKGVFVLLVFISHFIQYYDLTTSIDNAYMPFRRFLGQLVVVMFLFYSGYGITESIKKKGTKYVKKLPVNRCLKVMLHLVCGVLIFAVFDLIIGKKFTFVTFLLSLIGWANIGNSNWFIFTIVVLYFITYIAFMIFRKNPYIAVALVTALTIVYMWIISPYQDNYWYNTALCYALGMWYSLFKVKIEKVVMKNEIFYWLITIVTFVALLVAYKFRKNFVIYELYTLLFTMSVVFGSMKLKVGNPIINWFGKHIFSIYILQRIPMTVFGYIEFVKLNPYIYFVASLLTTMLIAYGFDKLMGLLDKKIFIRK